MYNVLITSCGGDAALTILQDLVPWKGYELYGMDRRFNNAGKRFLKFFIPEPSFTDDGKYLEWFVGKCKFYQIDAILPTHSSEMIRLAEWCAKDEYLAKRMLLPRLPTLRLGDDKYALYKYFKYETNGGMCIEVHSLFAKTEQIHIPKTYLPSEFPMQPSFDSSQWLLKLRHGSGSRDIRDLPFDFNPKNYLDEKWIVQEKIAFTKEITVDFLCNRKEQLIGSVQRLRERVRDGKVVQSLAVNEPGVETFLKSFLEIIPYRGVGNIQLLFKDNTWYLTDFNPRFAAGGLSLTIRMGLDIPLYMLMLIDDLIPTFSPNPTPQRMYRYPTSWFEDIDKKETTS